MNKIYKEKSVHQNHCPHFLINNSEPFSKTFIICDRKYINDVQNSSIIITKPDNLSAVIQFYKDSFNPPELTLLTGNSSEALIGLSEEIKIKFNEITISNKLPKRELALKKVEISSEEELYSHADAALFILLNDYPFTSAEKAVDVLYKLNQKLNLLWALDLANKKIAWKKDKLLKSKKITRKGFIKSWAPLLKPQSYLDGELGDIFIENGSTGTGKSQKIRRVVEASIEKGIKSVFICHRKTIAAGSLKGIDGVGYYDQIIPGGEDKIQCLVIVVNSIIRSNFQSFLNEVGLVILEEGKQVFDHIMIGEWDRSDDIYLRVKSLCEQAKSVVIADADANNDTISFAQDLKKKGDVRLLYNEADFSNITIEMNPYETIESKIYSAAIQNDFKPFMVASDRKEKVDELYIELLKKNPALKILTVTGDNNKNEEQLTFLAAPNEISENYDVIIYNSAITSSVSITTSRFKQHFGLFEGIITSSNVIQMLRRNRPCLQFNVGIKKTKIFKRLNEKDIPENLSEFERKCKILQCEEAFNTDNNIAALYFNALQDGFNVIVNNSNHRLEENYAENNFTDIEKNLIILNTPLSECQAYDKRDTRAKNKRIFMTLRLYFYHLIFDTLHIDKHNFTGEFCQVDANKLLTLIYKLPSDYKKIKLTPLNRGGQPKIGTNSVIKMLANFGLEAIRKKSSDGTYKISDESILATRKLAASVKSKTLS